MKIYLVGGAVRDQLLGRKITERDFVVVGATPEDLLSKGFRPVGNDFPVFLHPETHEEYALARTERKTGKGYTGFECFADPSVTLEQDLERRDLTINAMAKEWDDAELSSPETTKPIIDPFGGQQDLQKKILRHVSPAFAEDPVRILRVARFAARFPDFTVHPETNQLMQKMVAAGEVNALVPERVWKEFSRALTEENPSRFFSVLTECLALPILFPEFAHHSTRLDYLHRSIESHRLEPTDALLRFGALTLKLNKAEITSLCERLRPPTRFSETALLVSAHLHFFQTLDINDATAVVNFFRLIDAYRRPTRYFDFFNIASLTLEDSGKTAKSIAEFNKDLHAAFAVTKDIDAKLFIDQGLKGEEIGEAIHQARINTLRSHLK